MKSLSRVAIDQYLADCFRGSRRQHTHPQTEAQNYAGEQQVSLASRRGFREERKVATSKDVKLRIYINQNLGYSKIPLFASRAYNKIVGMPKSCNLLSHLQLVRTIKDSSSWLMPWLKHYTQGRVMPCYNQQIVCLK